MKTLEVSSKPSEIEEEHMNQVLDTRRSLFVFMKPIWADSPAASWRRTVPVDACHAHDSAAINPTLALKHASLFEGEIRENFVEKTDAW